MWLIFFIISYIFCWLVLLMGSTYQKSFKKGVIRPYKPLNKKKEKKRMEYVNDSIYIYIAQFWNLFVGHQRQRQKMKYWQRWRTREAPKEGHAWKPNNPSHSTPNPQAQSPRSETQLMWSLAINYYNQKQISPVNGRDWVFIWQYISGHKKLFE